MISPDAVPASTPSSQQPCRFCKEPIGQGAVYCKVCKQFQTTTARWRNELTFSALLGALPLFALIYGFVQDRTTRVRSEVRALPLQCGIDMVVVGLTNVGNRPAVVAGGTLRRKGHGQPSDWLLTNRAKEGALVIEPGKQVIAPFGVGGGALGQPPTASPGEQWIYAVALDVLEFGKAMSRREELTCSCPAG